MSRSFPVDTLVPTVEISAAPGPHSEPFAATFRWSEPVDGFDDGDVTVVGGSLGTLTTRTAGRVWTATVTPDDRRVDDAVVSVARVGGDRPGWATLPPRVRLVSRWTPVPPTFTRANHHRRQPGAGGQRDPDVRTPAVMQFRGHGHRSRHQRGDPTGRQIRFRWKARW